MKRKAIFGLLCCAISLWSAEKKPDKKPDKKKDPTEIGERNVAGRFNNFYSIDKELALGRQLSIEVRKQARVIDDPIVSEYLNRLCQTLARNSDVTFPVTCTLLDSAEINAFTLPGGFVFINTGMFRLSDNEAELASVLSHELGHAAARHATRQATRNDILAATTIPLYVFGGVAGLIMRPAAAVLEPMAFFYFSREFESEADLLGIQYLWKSGYDPSASVDMFERVESTERRHPGSVSKLFRTHPLTADRIEKTQKNINEILPTQNEYILNTSEYEEVRARLEKVSKAADRPASAHPTLRRAQ
ncbi:MAG TPA: M48 family metallopeptidase [Bryobacteraceae bacterium]|nr:M48 family metallopeptidase [Bryobacteraceae bacterium]